MWILLKALALRFIVGRTVGGALAMLLVVLVPFAGVLKFVGLPLLLILGLLGTPVVLLLGALGLPVMFALAIGAVLLAIIALLLTLGVLAVKFVLPLVLIVWFVRWIIGASRKRPQAA